MNRSVVETIAEGTTDGMPLSFFFFSFLAVLGAVAFRVINTLDSRVSHKDQEHVNIGCFQQSTAIRILICMNFGLFNLSSTLIETSFINYWMVYPSNIRGLIVTSKRPKKPLKNCEETMTPLHCCLIRTRAPSAGVFIDYAYMQALEKTRECY